MLKFLSISLCVFAMAVHSASAYDPILFASAFKPGEAGAIHAFQFDSASGAFKPLAQTTDVSNPFFLVVSPDKRFLYSIDAKVFSGPDNEFVAAYAIEGRTGKLKRLNKQSSLGTASCYLDIDNSGKSVLVANYTTGSVAALPVQENGTLGEAVSFIQHHGSSVDPQRQKSPNAHCIVISPDQRFALAADLGIDKIMIYQLDAQSATLRPNTAQPYAAVSPGSGPRHLTFHPHGQQVYVINELKNTITFFDYNAASGQLTARQTIPTLPADFTGVSHCADLKITPDGKYLYGTNRGHDSLAMYRIQDNGELELLGIEPSLGKGPQNLLISKDGRWLLCANMPGNNLVVFEIHPQTGQLKATGEPISIPMPSCLRWLD